VQQGYGNFVFTHPENIALQWAAEWGVPCASMALLSIAWALRPQTAFSRSHVPIGAFAALVAVGLQNMVDFSSEVPGIMVAMALCASMVAAGARAAEQRSGWLLPRRIHAGWVYGLAVLAVVAAIGVFRQRDDELFNEQRALRRAFATATHTLEPEKLSKTFESTASDNTANELKAFRAALHAAMRRHPTEPYFRYLGASAALAAGSESALPWVAQTLARSPIHGRAHLMLARDLLRKNPSQARLEYRIAIEQDSAVSEAFSNEAPQLVRSYFEAAELIPCSPETRTESQTVAAKSSCRARPWILAILSERLRARLPSTSHRLDALILQENPLATDPLDRAARDTLLDLKQAPWCQGTGAGPCGLEAMAAAKRFLVADPVNCYAHIALAESQFAAGQTLHAVAALEESIDSVTARDLCLKALVQLAVRADDRTRTTAALNKLADVACAEVDDCVQNLVFVASTEEGRHNARRALTIYRKATELAPQRADLWAEQARIAGALGLHAEAAEVFERLLTLEPKSARWQSGLDEQRKAAAERSLAVDHDELIPSP
jgi:tetratricopeptide (TPR) repeat protein